MEVAVNPLHSVPRRAQPLGERAMEGLRDPCEPGRQALGATAARETGDQRLPADRLSGHIRLKRGERDAVVDQRSFERGRVGEPASASRSSTSGCAPGSGRR